MRVALDGTPLVEATGGVRRYTEELFTALQERFGYSEFALVSDQLQPPVSQIERRWWACGLPLRLRRSQTDVFHGTDFSVPYWPVCASVVTIHDTSPWRHPSWQRFAHRVRRRTPWQLAARLPTLVITPSEAVRREVIQLFCLDPADVRAIPLAASRRFQPVAPFSWPRPYLLFVGTLEPRKNLPFLVDCWRSARKRSGLDLLICGRRRGDFSSIPAEDGLHILGVQPEARLPSLYAGARAVAYPSFYEGFGLPVLEAMQCGAAVLTSTDPAILEVGGDGVWPIDAVDRDTWSAAIAALGQSAETADRLRAAGLRRAGRFSWRRTAEQTYAVYEEARQRFAFQA